MMGFLSRLFGAKKPSAATSGPSPEQAVLISITLAGQWPTPEETQRWHALQDELAAAIKKARAGELDGDEWGEGTCTIYMYGPSADALWDAIEGVIAERPIPAGSYAIKRYGGPDCDRQERISIEWAG